MEITSRGRREGSREEGRDGGRDGGGWVEGSEGAREGQSEWGAEGRRDEGLENFTTSMDRIHAKSAKKGCAA